MLFSLLFWGLSGSSILEQMQAGRPALIKKDGAEMLIAIVLDRALAEAKALVEAPDAFIQAITRIMQDKQNHPYCTNDQEAMTYHAESAASSSGGYSQRVAEHVPSAAAYALPISASRESIKNASSASAIGVQSVRPPTWFEDFAVPKGSAPQTDQGQPQPLHGLKLVTVVAVAVRWCCAPQC